MRGLFFLLCSAALLTACQTTGTGAKVGRGDVTLSWDTQGILHNYMTAPAPEFFVLSPDRQKHLVLTCKKGKGQCNPTQMKKGVEAYCKDKFGGTECRIFAEGKTVVWNGGFSLDTIGSVRPDQWCDRHQQNDVVCLYFAQQDYKTCIEDEQGTPQYQCEKGDLDCETPMPELLPAAAYETCRTGLWKEHVIASIENNELDYGLCKKGVLSEPGLVSECAVNGNEVTGHLIPLQANIKIDSLTLSDRIKFPMDLGQTQQFSASGYISTDTDKRRGRIILYGEPRDLNGHLFKPLICTGSVGNGEFWITQCPMLGWGTFGNFLIDHIYEGVLDELYMSETINSPSAFYEARPNDVIPVKRAGVELVYHPDRYDDATISALPDINRSLWLLK